MTYAPDYGLWLMNQGADKDFTMNFVSFRLDHISAVEPNQFTTMVNIPHGDGVFAMTVDFSVDILQDIIPFCSVETAQLIVEWANNLQGPDTLELTELPIFGLTAKLGELESNAQESYVPLVAQSIYGYDQ